MCPDFSCFSVSVDQHAHYMPNLTNKQRRPKVGICTFCVTTSVLRCTISIKITRECIWQVSSGSSGWVRGAEKHEIYVAAFGGHIFYDLFSQGPLAPPPGSATDIPEGIESNVMFMDFVARRCRFVFK